MSTVLEFDYKCSIGGCLPATSFGAAMVSFVNLCDTLGQGGG